jgi:hypothetical protein
LRPVVVGVVLYGGPGGPGRPCLVARVRPWITRIRQPHSVTLLVAADGLAQAAFPPGGALRGSVMPRLGGGPGVAGAPWAGAVPREARGRLRENRDGRLRQDAGPDRC